MTITTITIFPFIGKKFGISQIFSSSETASELVKILTVVVRARTRDARTLAGIFNAGR